MTGWFVDRPVRLTNKARTRSASHSSLCGPFAPRACSSLLLPTMRVAARAHVLLALLASHPHSFTRFVIGDRYVNKLVMVSEGLER